MAWSLRKIVCLAAVLCSQVQIGLAGFHPRSLNCILVDVDMYYDPSKIGQFNLDEANRAFKKSSFTQTTTSHWQNRLKDECSGIDVIFDDIYYKASKNRAHVLAVTYLYEFEDGVSKPNYRNLHRCINATKARHERYVKEFNLLSSLPGITGNAGKKVKPYNALYDKNIRHCCQEKQDNSCCPKQATFITEGQSSSCQCREGYYYKTLFACHACPKDTYQPKPNMQTCKPCLEGNITLGEGATSCIPKECSEEINWTVKGTFTWKTTEVNNTAKHGCPHGPSNVTVTRTCLGESNKTFWGMFDTSSCNESKHTMTLLELSQTQVNDSNAKNITENLVMETADSTELDSYDVFLATSTLVHVVDYTSSLDQVAENVLKVIDNLLSVDEDVLAESQFLNQTTSRLVNTTESFAENVPLTNGTFSIAAKNIEVESQVIAKESVDDGITSLANLTQQNSSSPIQSQITIDAKALQIAKQRGSNRAITIFYKNSKLFPVLNGTRSSKSKTNDRKRNRNIGNVVLAGKFKDASISNVERAIELSFPEYMKKDEVPRCVFWDFTANDGFGNWSSEGCIYSGTKSGHVTCHCNHMTNFAILLTADPDRDETNSSHRQALSVISYVGCAVSLIAIVLTLITYCFFRDLRHSNAQTILCHLCIALIGLLVSYCIVATRNPKTTGCLVSSLLVHYFLLAMFCWMGVEGINMYLAFVKVMSAHVPRFIPKAVLIGWGCPGLIVIITGSVAFDKYSTDGSCFLHDLPFYISVFTPAAIVLFTNFIMFLLTMYSLAQMGKQVSQENKIKGFYRIKVALAILVLLGVTWLFGTLAIGDARLSFQYLFCIFNSLQGFAIFWFHCVRQPEVRQCWADFLRGRRGRKRRYTASTTVPGLATNALKKSSSNASPKFSPRPRTTRKYNVQERQKGLDASGNTTGTI